MSLIVAAAWLFVTVQLAAVAYRAIFAVAYLLRGTGERDLPTETQSRRFAVLIPAHDEELLIREVIASIRASDYPQDCLDIYVIADNCKDSTADLVRAAGEQVAERNDPENPGKGQALDWMLRRTDLSAIDAVAIFDADNLVDPAFFQIMNAELARGGRCLQGYYGIANPNDSVMTRLLAVTYVMKNLLFNGGKAVLGLSPILMGTGMVFVRDVIERVGWQAMSIGEDLEQTFCLHEAGERIRFVPKALARAQEATTLRQAYPQRQRWATGRRVLYSRARRAITIGIRERSLSTVDLAIDLFMPPYSKLMNWSVASLIVAIFLFPYSPWLLGATALVFAYQLAELMAALWLMKADSRFLAPLLFAPIFLLWKAGIDLLAAVGHRRNEWARTARTPHATDATAQAPENDDSRSSSADRNTPDKH